MSLNVPHALTLELLPHAVEDHSLELDAAFDIDLADAVEACIGERVPTQHDARILGDLAVVRHQQRVATSCAPHLPASTRNYQFHSRTISIILTQRVHRHFPLLSGGPWPRKNPFLVLVGAHLHCRLGAGPGM